MSDQTYNTIHSITTYVCTYMHTYIHWLLIIERFLAGMWLIIRFRVGFHKGQLAPKAIKVDDVLFGQKELPLMIEPLNILMRELPYKPLGSISWYQREAYKAGFIYVLYTFGSLDIVIIWI